MLNNKLFRYNIFSKYTLYDSKLNFYKSYKSSSCNNLNSYKTVIFPLCENCKYYVSEKKKCNIFNISAIECRFDERKCGLYGDFWKLK